MNQIAQNPPSFSANDLNQIESGIPGFKFAGQPIGNVITAALPYVFAFAGVALLIYLISGGLSYMLSRGDPKAIANAQSKITNALIGFLIIFVAYWVVQAAARILGLTAISNIFR
jgi:hypothetical protein